MASGRSRVLGSWQTPAWNESGGISYSDPNWQVLVRSGYFLLSIGHLKSHRLESQVGDVLRLQHVQVHVVFPGLERMTELVEN